MSTFDSLWQKLAKSKTYREEFVATQLKRAIPFQIHTLMKKKGYSQEKLAALSNLTQGVISRAANPNYGNLTLNTIIRIAAGFDVAFIGIFVPFSELGRWFINLSEESIQVPSFAEESGEETVSIDSAVSNIVQIRQYREASPTGDGAARMAAKIPKKEPVPAKPNEPPTPILSMARQ